MNLQQLQIAPGELPANCIELREEVRAFIADNMANVPGALKARNWTRKDPAFSRKMAAKGWIGMTWPRRYGGHERTFLERYVVLEELLAAGAPVGAHWAADRQSGPLLMRYAPDTLAPEYVPRIVKADAFFCIGMSEPDAGSDLASIRTKARLAGEHWVVNGRKVWTSGAHTARYMIALVRTGNASEDRHAGMSQLLIDLNLPGVTVRPLITLTGEHDFNEVTFDDVQVPRDHLIGTEGEGWRQVGSELAFERSGPERYLSSTQGMLEMLDAATPSNAAQAIALGRLTAQFATLREMSLGVAGMLAEGKNPMVAASIVKDQGALLEQSIPDIAHDQFGGLLELDHPMNEAMRYLTMAAPSFSLRGGTREILRGIVARNLGLR